MATTPSTLTQARVVQACTQAAAAATQAGLLLKRELHREKRAHLVARHDIKLELDVRCQNLIHRSLRRALPGAGFLGEEEGDHAQEEGLDLRWVVDPIDGTVNYAHGLPHACVSIALQERVEASDASPAGCGYRTIAGVLLDPFRDELWTATLQGPARLNGRRIRVSTRRRLGDIMVAMGLSKQPSILRGLLPVFGVLIPKVRKVRMMGAAALDLVYVATGRLDAYVEARVRLWDIAAGGLIVERAGGRFWHQAIPDREPHVYRVLASNGHVHGALMRLTRVDQR